MPTLQARRALKEAKKKAKALRAQGRPRQTRPAAMPEDDPMVDRAAPARDAGAESKAKQPREKKVFQPLILNLL